MNKSYIKEEITKIKNKYLEDHKDSHYKDLTKNIYNEIIKSVDEAKSAEDIIMFLDNKMDDDYYHYIHYGFSAFDGNIWEDFMNVVYDSEDKENV